MKSRSLGSNIGSNTPSRERDGIKTNVLGKRVSERLEGTRRLTWECEGEELFCGATEGRQKDKETYQQADSREEDGIIKEHEVDCETLGEGTAAEGVSKGARRKNKDSFTCRRENKLRNSALTWRL